MELWIRAHLLTEHRWDHRLWLEAFDLDLQAYMASLWDRMFAPEPFDLLRWKIMFNYAQMAPLSFAKIRVVDV